MEPSHIAIPYIQPTLMTGPVHSEQIFRLLVSVGNSSTASVSTSNQTLDFALGTLGRPTTTITFLPTETLPTRIFVGLFPDNLYEGPETIILCHSPVAGFPQYSPLGDSCAEIIIRDAQSKCHKWDKRQ